MTKTYTQLLKQIDALARDAERLKKNEVKDVVTRIKEALATYGLTAADLGLGARRGPKPDSSDRRPWAEKRCQRR